MDLIDKTISQYRIISQLGVGGMGEVYRARDAKLNRDVAVKILPEMFAQDAERLARFNREAQVLASLNHPIIAAIYGLEESDGSGRNEIYGRPYPEGTRVQISVAGGSQPVWSSNGRELFFRSGDQLLAVNVTPGPNFSAGKPAVLFSRSMPEDSSGRAYDFMADYDVSTDGRRFGFPKYKPNSSNIPRVRVVLDWFLELKRITNAEK